MTFICEPNIPTTYNPQFPLMINLLTELAYIFAAIEHILKYHILSSTYLNIYLISYMIPA